MAVKSRSSKTRSPGSTAREGAATLSRRKQEHIQACLDDEVDRRANTLASHKLRYLALPEMALDEVSTETTFAGQSIAAPLIISCMTGGPGATPARINRNLAKGAQALGIPLGLGSMRVLLAEPRARASFAVRDLAPGVPLIANLGLVSFNHGMGLEDVERIIDLVRPDVLGLHLNALQEVIQEGGDTDFRGLTAHLRTLCREVELPVFVKECGGGIAPHLVEDLFRAGADYVDISGNDGTSWAAVEGRLSSDPGMGELFKDFGLPTAWILERLSRAMVKDRRVVAGGGIRTGLQAAQALALGAGYVTMARPFLLAAMKSAGEVEALGRQVIDQLRTAMFLVGARDLAGLTREVLLEPPEFPRASRKS